MTPIGMSSREFAELKAKIMLEGSDEVKAQLKDVQEQGEKVGKAITEASEKASVSLDQFGIKATQLGGILERNVTLPIVALGTAAVASTFQLQGVPTALAAMSNEGRASMGSLREATDGFKAAVMGLRVEVAESLAPTITNLINENLSPLIEKLGELAQEWGEQSASVKNTQLAILAVVALSGPFTVFVGQMAQGLNALIILFSGVSAAALATSAAVSAVIAGAVVIGGTVYWALDQQKPTSPDLIPDFYEIQAPAGMEYWDIGRTPGRAVTPPPRRPTSLDEFLGLSIQERADWIAQGWTVPPPGAGGGAGGAGAADPFRSYRQPMKPDPFSAGGFLGTSRQPIGGQGGLARQQQGFNYYGPDLMQQEQGFFYEQPGVPMWMRNDFLMQTGVTAMGGAMQGGARGALGAALPAIGMAVGGAPGAAIGALLSGLLGKQERGSTPNNPVYVEEIKKGDLATVLSNVFKAFLGQAGAANFDLLVQQMHAQSAERGLT